MLAHNEVKIRILDEVNCIIVNLHPDHVAYFYEEYAREAPNYFFNPKFKLGSWDGKIRYFHTTGKTYVYLLDEIIPRIVALGYKIKLEDLRSAQHYEADPVNKDHFSHIEDPETGEPIELRPYQVEGVNNLIRNGGGVMIAATGAGKAQPLNSKVLTPTGWKTMGDIVVGDVVVGPTGNVANVIGVFPQGNKDIYEIEFHDGSKTRACKEHLWKTKFPKKLHTGATEDRIVSTMDIIEFLERKKSGVHTPGNVSIPLCAPIDTNHPPTQPLDPYLIGLLLGDGCLKNTPIFTSSDTELVEEAEDKLTELNVTLKYTGYGYDYRICKPDRSNWIKNDLIEILTSLGLYGTSSYTKFIPSVYKQGSVEQRLSLLQGLMDTDGTVDKRGNCSYSTSSNALASDVQELCWSLGMVCTKTKKITNIGTESNTLFIRCNHPKQLFRLKRKQDRCPQTHSDGRVELTRRVVSVTKVSNEPAQCIMLDSNDHLYITDDYIVTHNTIMTAALVDAYHKKNTFLKTLVIVPSSDLVMQTREDLIFFGLNVGEYSGDVKDINHPHVVSTWQALQKNGTLMKEFDLVVVDEAHGLKGQVLTKLLNENGNHIVHRFGLTGTLPKPQTDRMAVHIAVGSVQFTITAIELIKQGWLAKLDIDILQIEEDLRAKYNEFKKDHPMSKTTYTQFKDGYYGEYSAEKSYLQTNKDRMEYIKHILITKQNEQKGNVFCLVDGVNFGKKLTKLIPGAIFVYGKDKKKARREVYDLFKNNDNLIVIATVHVASTGLNIKRIFNLVFVDMGKSFVRIIQTIGRGLRKAPDKDYVKVTDICSDLKYGKRHLNERSKFYREAEYPFKKHKVSYAAPELTTWSD